MARVLYLTHDGITDHIGQAQIAPYILGLAGLGHKLVVVSAEKPGREALIEHYRAVFAAADVEWTFVPYANKPPLISSFITLARLHKRAADLLSAKPFDLIHCRSYLPFEVAIRLKRRFGTKLLLDVRDLWLDLRLETAPFKFVYRYLKRREPQYFAAADEVVTLTARAIDVLMSWYPSALGGVREKYTVIPCCADFRLFDLSAVDPAKVAAHRSALGLGDGPVLLYLGSLGADYLLPRMIELFQALRSIDQSATFLFVSNNAAEQVEQARIAAEIPVDAIKFVSVQRAQVPEYLALADLSVVFVRSALSKAGGSPTKLAELFACNVPVVANTGVGDLDAIIDYERNGSVIVEDFAPETLRAALHKVLALPRAKRHAIRDASLDFTLDEGVRRYARIYDRLAGPDATSPAA